MEIYLVFRDMHDFQLVWTLEQAQEALRTRYRDSWGRENLGFEEDLPGQWVVYDYSQETEKGAAPMLDEKIIRMELPSISGDQDLGALPEGASAQFLMQVTTRTGTTSMAHVETGTAWDSMHLGRAYLIEQFAARAGRALADFETKETPR